MQKPFSTLVKLRCTHADGIFSQNTAANSGTMCLSLRRNLTRNAYFLVFHFPDSLEINMTH